MNTTPKCPIDGSEMEEAGIFLPRLRKVYLCPKCGILKGVKL